MMLHFMIMYMKLISKRVRLLNLRGVFPVPRLLRKINCRNASPQKYLCFKNPRGFIALFWYKERRKYTFMRKENCVSYFLLPLSFETQCSEIFNIERWGKVSSTSIPMPTLISLLNLGLRLVLIHAESNSVISVFASSK